MNIRDVRLGKKLGPKFFESLDALSQGRAEFTNFKKSTAIRILETLDNEDSEKGLSQYNSEIASFWFRAFRYKFEYYVNSVICNSIASEKLDEIAAYQIAHKILKDDSLEDIKSLISSILHYEILAEYYYASHMDSWGQADLDRLENYINVKNIDGITTQVLQEYLATDVIESINTNIVMHYLRLFEHSFEIFSKKTGFNIPDDDLLKYQLILTQSFVKRGLENSETCGEEIKKFIIDSFNPE